MEWLDRKYAEMQAYLRQPRVLQTAGVAAYQLLQHLVEEERHLAPGVAERVLNENPSLRATYLQEGEIRSQILHRVAALYLGADDLDRYLSSDCRSIADALEHSVRRHRAMTRTLVRAIERRVEPVLVEIDPSRKEG